MSFENKKLQSVLLISLSIITYVYLGYFLERQQFIPLVFSWLILFGAHFYILKTNFEDTKLLLQLSILFRLIFLFSIPNLSQDFYRFIWDGRLILNGFNPYDSVPETFIQQGILPFFGAQELYDGMGALNGGNFSNYPPLHQLHFVIATVFGGTSIFWTLVALKIQILLADVGILIYGRKILKKLGIHPNQIFWYGLNPLIIIELTGNAHFEPVMLFFLVFSIHVLLHMRWILAALLFGLSVSVKLIPLLLLPIFYQWFSNFGKQKKLQFIGFGFLAILVNVILFIPFLSESLLSNFSSSIGLWFTSFEFNASFYYLFREIGYGFRGWNEIGIIGKVLPILVIIYIMYLSFVKKIRTTIQFITLLLFALTFYYLFSTTVHPWYLASLVLLGCFTTYKYSIIWTSVVVLSYYAYSQNPYLENLIFVFIEYLILFVFMFWEYQKKSKSRIYSYNKILK